MKTKLLGYVARVVLFLLIIYYLPLIVTVILITFLISIEVGIKNKKRRIKNLKDDDIIDIQFTNDGETKNDKNLILTKSEKDRLNHLIEKSKTEEGLTEEEVNEMFNLSE